MLINSFICGDWWYEYGIGITDEMWKSNVENI